MHRADSCLLRCLRTLSDDDLRTISDDDYGRLFDEINADMERGWVKNFSLSNCDE